MSEADEEQLKKRGLTSKAIKRCGYRTWDSSQSSAIVKAVVQSAQEKAIEITSIPGFFLKDRRVEFYAPDGLLIPLLNVDGEITALKVRRDGATDSSKYVTVSSHKRGGASPGAPVHVPIDVPRSSKVVRVTEGELKADIATAQSNTATISIAGVSQYRGALSTLKELGAKQVLVAFDADFRRKQSVARHLVRFVLLLQSEGYEVVIETWAEGKGKGIDDLLVAGHQPKQLSGPGVEALRNAIERKFGEIPHPDPVRIQLGAETHRINDLSIRAIERSRKLFLQDELLVRLQKDANQGVKSALARPSTAIHELSRLARYEALDKRNEEWRQIPPPKDEATYVLEHADLTGLRALRGITSSPVIRADGSLHNHAGYDAYTQLLQIRRVKLESIPRKPLMEDVVRSVETLMSVVEDFPFENDAGRSAWLAYLITLLTRHLVDGPVPMFLVSANTAGAGKGLLVESAWLIASGERLPVTPLPQDDAEMRKQLTSLVIANVRCVLFDNVRDRLDRPALEAAITSGRWRDRVLGGNTLLDANFRMIVAMTANNPEMTSDLARRMLPLSLRSTEEHPDLRSDFNHPDLLEWIKCDRSRLLAAAFTIVRGYLQAGRPRSKLSGWGSFDQWSAFVRGMLVWSGCVDPNDARAGLRELADTELEMLAQLLSTLEQLQRNDRTFAGRYRVQQLLNWLQNPVGLAITVAQQLRTSLAALTSTDEGQLNAVKVGMMFKKYAHRVCGGLRLTSKKVQNASSWFVERVTPS